MEGLLIPLFFLTALIYSMAGLGGGSTYLALLALFAFPYEQIPQTALLCNLIVVAGGCWQFSGHFSLKRVLPFVLTSLPAAYWGGTISVDKTVFTLILGLSLCVAALRMAISDHRYEGRAVLPWKRAWLVGLPVGALFGLLSGLVGIGGGIYLSPTLLLLGWADSRQAAAAASFFILVNSLAGLAGHWAQTPFSLEQGLLLPLLLAVLIGGQIGSRLGSRKIPRLALQRITAFLILFVCGRLFWMLASGGLQ